MGPCGPSKQLPLGDSCRQASAALLSFDLDCGENAEFGWNRTIYTLGPRSNYCDGCNGKMGIGLDAYCIRQCLCNVEIGDVICTRTTERIRHAGKER